MGSMTVAPKIKVSAGVLVDLGNSETRVIVMCGGKEKRFILSNRFKIMQKGAEIDKRYKETGDTYLMMYNGAPVANGRLVLREYTSSAVYPMLKRPKHEQATSLFSLHLIFIKCIEWLEQEYKCDSDKLDITFNVSVLLPPKEESMYAEAFKNQIKQINSVECLLPHAFKKNFKIGEVNIEIEGVSAFYAAYFDEKDNELIERDVNKDFGEGYVLILDIGAGTTDLALIKDCELVTSSRDSFDLGGNTIASILQREAEKRYGLSYISDETCRRAIKEGVMTVGAKKLDISDLLMQAKREYAEQVRQKVASYVDRQQVNMVDIKGVLIVGGGSMATVSGDKVISPAVSAIVFEDVIEKLTPYAIKVNTEGLNPRLMNIEGLRILYKYL